MGPRPQGKRDEDLQEAAGTPGITRRVAFEEPDSHWFGHIATEAGMTSGWHHHGEMTTFGYVLEGTLWFEFGPGGSDRVELGAGEYFEVPAGVVHREGTTADGPGSAVLGRVGRGQPVFPVDGPDPA